MVAADTVRTDILISIYPEHVANIAARAKTHEFRKYLLPMTVTRMWIYETAPISAIRYCAAIGPGKKPGELTDDEDEDLDGGGVGKNRKFNNGDTLKPGGSGSQYAYKISALHRLSEDVTLAELKAKGWAGGAPQKYNFAPREMVEQLEKGMALVFS